MTNTPPNQSRSSRRKALTLDELIAIFVAFLSIGGILFWSWSRRGNDIAFNLPGLTSSQPTNTVNTLPGITPNPTGISPDATINSGSQSPNANLNFGANTNSGPSLPNTSTESQPSSLSVPSLSVPSLSVAPIPIVPAPAASPTIPAIPENPITQVVPPPLLDLPTTEEPKSSPETKLEDKIVTPSAKKSTIPPPIAFNDVPKESWSLPFINVLSSRKIISGFPDYSFRPNQPVNRAEFASIIGEAFNKELGVTTVPFKDIPPKFWASNAIDQSTRTGFLKGYPGQVFRPEQKIPKVQVIVSLVTGLGLKPKAPIEKTLSIYTDANQIPKYALDKVAAATEAGMIVNYPDSKVFSPNQEATRADVAAMVHQALVKTGKLQPISSPNIVKPPQ
jgi:S-layer homology domain